MGEKLSQEEVEKKICNNFTEEIVTVISNYNGMTKEIKVKCEHCGYIMLKKANHFLNKAITHRCPRCKKNEDESFCWTVYEHLFPNGKRYIGITSQLVKDRWDRGRGYNLQKKMKNAIQEFGWDNIQHNILFERLTRDEAEEKEIELIEKYETINPNFGYNTTFRWVRS